MFRKAHQKRHFPLRNRQIISNLHNNMEFYQNFDDFAIQPVYDLYHSLFINIQSSSLWVVGAIT